MITWSTARRRATDGHRATPRRHAPRIVLLVGAALGVLSTTPLSAQGARNMSVATVAARATPATVTIITFGTSGDTLALGSGFIVRSSGVIVTNWHVMSGASSATVILPSGESYDRVLYLDGDSSRDVVLLQIPGAGLPTIPVRDDVPPPGSPVVVIGSPLGLAHTVTNGVVSATRMVRGHELVQVSAAISHGSSGGPVLDMQGRVFAIASAFIQEGQALNFAVPVRYAVGLLALRPTARALGDAPTARGALAANDSSATTLSATLWSPPRVSVPRPAVQGTFGLFRWAHWTAPDSASTAPVRGFDVMVLNDSGFGIRGLNCDSLDVCTSASGVVVRSAPSGTVVVDLGYMALDGYQTDSGFVAHGKYQPESPGGFDLWYRAWLGSVPLSHRTGLYSCGVRTVFRGPNGLEDGYTDWSGQAVVVETDDSVHVNVMLANASGGTIGGLFAGNRDERSNQMEADGSLGRMYLTISWSYGYFRGDWVDRRTDNASFVGPLQCRRQ